MNCLLQAKQFIGKGLYCSTDVLCLDWLPFSVVLRAIVVTILAPHNLLRIAPIRHALKRWIYVILKSLINSARKIIGYSRKIWKECASLWRIIGCHEGV